MAIKNPKTPRVTRKEKKVAKMYADNPTWAKEDAPGAYKKGGAIKKMQKGGPNRSQPSIMKTQVAAEKLYDTDPSVRTYTNEFTGKKIPTGPMTYDEYQNAAERAGSKRGQAMMAVPGYKKGGTTKKMYKTGGMVNANAKITAGKKATGSVGGTTKAISKVAVKAASPKGKVGGTSKAPKKASPVKLAKAKMGGMKGKSC